MTKINKFITETFVILRQPFYEHFLVGISKHVSLNKLIKKYAFYAYYLPLLGKTLDFRTHVENQYVHAPDRKQKQKTNKLFFFSDQQRQTAFKIMSDSRIRKSKEDNTLSGTIATHKDNNCKLDIMNNSNDYLTTLSSVIINENDVSHLTNLCEKHLQQSYEVVKINLAKINAETNQIMNAENRINHQDHPDVPNPKSIFLSLARDNAGSTNNSQTVSDKQ